jgi:hypothetical protein
MENIIDLFQKYISFGIRDEELESEINKKLKRLNLSLCQNNDLDLAFINSFTENFKHTLANFHSSKDINIKWFTSRTNAVTYTQNMEGGPIITQLEDYFSLREIPSSKYVHCFEITSDNVEYYARIHCNDTYADSTAHIHMKKRINTTLIKEYVIQLKIKDIVLYLVDLATKDNN